MNNKFKKFAGFTLIELLVTIVIISILATISISTYHGFQEKAKIAKLAMRISQEKKFFQVECIGSGKEIAECPISYRSYAISNPDTNFDHYGALPSYCKNFCEEKTNEILNKFVRIPTKEEAIWFAKNTHQTCACMWHYKDNSAQMLGGGYPMYYNRTSGGCGALNTGDIARYIPCTSFSYKEDYNGNTKWDCACITYPKIK